MITIPTHSMPLPVDPDANVYLIQQPKPRKSDGWMPDLQPATRFGRLITVMQAGETAWTNPDEAARKLKDEYSQFDPTRDFLLWTNFGDPCVLWLTIMVLVGMGHRSLSFLYWSRGKGPGGMTNENGYYFPIKCEV